VALTGVATDLARSARRAARGEFRWNREGMDEESRDASSSLDWEPTTDVGGRPAGSTRPGPFTFLKRPWSILPHTRAPAVAAAQNRHNPSSYECCQYDIRETSSIRGMTCQTILAKVKAAVPSPTSQAIGGGGLTSMSAAVSEPHGVGPQRRACRHEGPCGHRKRDAGQQAGAPPANSKAMRRYRRARTRPRGPNTQTPSN
jgi:hypothetical protein